jgi:hypothetical protein
MRVRASLIEAHIAGLRCFACTYDAATARPPTI